MTGRRIFVSALATLVMTGSWQGCQCSGSSVHAQSETSNFAYVGDSGPEHITADLRSIIESQPESYRLIDVIVETVGHPNIGHFDRVRLHGGEVKHTFANINAMLAEVPVRNLERLANCENIKFVSPDRQVSSALDATTKLVGVDRLRQQAWGVYGTSYPPADGTGVGIAIIDSGISTPGNDDFQLNTSGKSRVVCFQDLVGDSNGSGPHDDYGHGTTVAGVAAGSGWGSQQRDNHGNLWYPGNYGNFAGMAPDANLVVIKALDSNGIGTISTAIKAMDLCISMKAAYNIRVMNLSFGAPVLQSYKTDPLCQEAEKCVANGIVVVCAAGNYGHNDVVTGYDPSGKPIYQTLYGGIVSPGNDPKVVTVGATKDPMQTAETWSGSKGQTTVNYNPNPQALRRSDLQVASFSSRGPTLIDGAIKPDLVAPGTKVIAAATRNTATLTSRLLPNTVMPRSSNGGVPKMYCQLTGTSFAAPVVSGIAALMLQANPGLTPRTVKAILMMTAQRLPSLGPKDIIERLLTEGAGLVNAYAAVRLSQNICANGCSSNAGQDLLRPGVSLSGLDPDLKLAMTNQYGTPLEYALLDSGLLLADGHLLADGFFLADGFLLADGHLLADGFLVADGHLLADGLPSSDGFTFGAGSVWPSGLLLTNSYVGANCLQPVGGQLAVVQTPIQAALQQQPLQFYADGTIAATGNVDGGVAFSSRAINIWGSSVIDPTSIPASAAAESINIMGSNDDVPISRLTIVSGSSPYYPKRN
jgi:serine protease AprX